VGHPSHSTLERTHSTLGQQRRTSDPLLDVRRPQLSNSAVGSTPRRPNSRCSSSGKALPLFSNGLSSSTCPVNLLSSAGSFRLSTTVVIEVNATFEVAFYLYAPIVIVTVDGVVALLLYVTQKRSASFITILKTVPSGLCSNIPSPTTLL